MYICRNQLTKKDMERKEIEQAVENSNASVLELAEELKAEGIKARVAQYNEYIGTIEAVVKRVSINPKEIGEDDLKKAMKIAFYYGWRFELVEVVLFGEEKGIIKYHTNNATMLRQELGIQYSVTQYPITLN